jgi:nitrate reductase gamma subunit
MENSPLSLEVALPTPEPAKAFDIKLDLSHALLVIAGQFAVITVILLSWVGKDLTYSSGLAHPIFYYFVIAMVIIAVFGLTGILLRRDVSRRA